MPRTIQELAAVRDGIRRQWLLPVPPGLLPAAEIQDTSDETLALLSKQRLFAPALIRALQSGNPDAIAAAAPRPPRGAPRGTGRLTSLVGDFDTLAVTSLLSIGPIAFPYIIRHLFVSSASVAAAGAFADISLRLYLTGGDRTGETALPPDRQIYPDYFVGNTPPTILKLGGPGHATASIPLAITILETNRFLTAAAITFTAATTNTALTIIIEEVDLGQWTLGDLVPIGRQSLSPANPPPAPRLPTRSTPRGAVVRVTQAGRILAERRISWEALDGSIRATWFNQQVGAPPDPSVEWIQ